jgi:hypothetical protein
METLIVHPKSRKQLATVEAILKALDVSFKKEEENSYNPEFVATILESYERAKKGEVITIENPKNIWPSIL